MPLLRASSCVAAALALLSFTPTAQSDPVLALNATSLSVTYNHVDYFNVSGPGFSFTGNSLGENLPYTVNPGAVFDRITASLVGTTEFQYVPGGSAQLQGFITVAGVSRPALFSGAAFTNSGSTTFPTDLSVLPTVLSVPLTIQGSFTGCLQPASVGAAAPCDPNFLNYATVNVNLPGTYNFSIAQAFTSYPAIQVVGESYTAAAMATPEPSSALLASVGISILGIGAQLYRRALPFGHKLTR